MLGLFLFVAILVDLTRRIGVIQASYKYIGKDVGHRGDKYVKFIALSHERNNLQLRLFLTSGDLISCTKNTPTRTGTPSQLLVLDKKCQMLVRVFAIAIHDHVQIPTVPFAHFLP